MLNGYEKQYIEENLSFNLTSCSTYCSTIDITKAVVCAILSDGSGGNGFSL